MAICATALYFLKVEFKWLSFFREHIPYITYNILFLFILHITHL
jgi:hypothetical protein